MSFISLLDRDLAVGFLPMMPVRLVELLHERDVVVVEVPDHELESQGPNVLALGPRVALALEAIPRPADAWNARGSTCVRSWATRSRGRRRRADLSLPTARPRLTRGASNRWVCSRAMYDYWVLLHILAVIAFAACHGVSMFALYRIRALGLDRERIADMVAFSGTTTRPMYISLAVIVVAGTVLSVQGKWLGDWWLWLAIAVLVVTTVLMTLIAKPYFQRITAACAIRPSGVPRVSDEELHG